MSEVSDPQNPLKIPSELGNPEVNYFGLANYRNQNRKFGIKLDDRRRHMYVVGKTGMGKTTLLENMVLNDIYAGHGLGYVDPHGDTAEKILNYIPANRINDVVYFNPADMDYPIGFNILETIRPDQKHLVASGLMGVFKKIWPDVWSSRMEYILNNTILALLDFPGTTLLGINRLLADEEYRRRVVNNTKDPVIKAFWQTEFASYNDKYKQEAVAPIQNKIGQFLSASVIRNIVAQVKSRIDIREIMDNRKIFIMNLSKGRIGEDNSRLLGGMLITKIQLSAMERVDMPETSRPDFFLYVDEFQNFATESFANILSEARKYRLDLTMAHQYMEQLEEEVLAAVIGNVGSIVTFRVGSTDAEILAKEFIPTFVEEDLINLPKFHIYLKLMIDGVASKPFSALTMSPIAIATGSMEKVIKVSRERYAQSRDKIEDKIARWSGMVVIPGDEAAELDIDDEDAMFVHEKKPDAPKVAAVLPTNKPGSAPSAKPPAKPAPAPNKPPAPASKLGPAPVSNSVKQTPNSTTSVNSPTNFSQDQKSAIPTTATSDKISVTTLEATVEAAMIPGVSGQSPQGQQPARSQSGNVQSAQPNQPNKFGQSGNQQNQPGKPGQPGFGKNNKNKNRNNNGGQNNFAQSQANKSFAPGNPVTIVDTEQKGISLSSLQPKQESTKPVEKVEKIEQKEILQSEAVAPVIINQTVVIQAPKQPEQPVVHATTVEPEKIEPTPNIIEQQQSKQSEEKVEAKKESKIELAPIQKNSSPEEVRAIPEVLTVEPVNVVEKLDESSSALATPKHRITIMPPEFLPENQKKAVSNFVQPKTIQPGKVEKIDEEK